MTEHKPCSSTCVTPIKAQPCSYSFHSSSLQVSQSFGPQSKANACEDTCASLATDGEGKVLTYK